MRFLEAGIQAPEYDSGWLNVSLLPQSSGLLTGAVMSVSIQPGAMALTRSSDSEDVQSAGSIANKKAFNRP
jgi:hypothetical protein